MRGHDKNHEKPPLPLYQSQPPPWLPPAHISSELGITCFFISHNIRVDNETGYVGYHPPRVHQEEDVLSDANVKNGFALPLTVPVCSYHLSAAPQSFLCNHAGGNMYRATGSVRVASWPRYHNQAAGFDESSFCPAITAITVHCVRTKTPHSKTFTQFVPGHLHFVSRLELPSMTRSDRHGLLILPTPPCHSISLERACHTVPKDMIFSIFCSPIMLLYPARSGFCVSLVPTKQ